MNPTARPCGDSGGRFDSLDGSYGYLYVGSDPDAAIAEAICRDLPFDGHPRIVPHRALVGLALTRIEVTTGMLVVSLHGADLAQVGQDLWLTKSDPDDYPVTRAWAAAILGWAPRAAGLVYRCRHDEDRIAWCLTCPPDVVAHPRLRVLARPLPLGSPLGLVAVRGVLARHNAALSRD
ncbi:MAG: RES family NAD+ phosphorylase [Actinomycetota bacterium]|nr:RES family NAD+ phosphorylase [Actinomycetota bacterium]